MRSPFASNQAPGDRIEGSDPPLDFGCGLAPVDPGFGLLDLGRIGLSGDRLRFGGCWSLQPFRQQPSADIRHFFRDFSSALTTNIECLPGKHRPGVEPLIHLHQGNAANLVVGEDRALDRELHPAIAAGAKHGR